MRKALELASYSMVKKIRTVLVVWWGWRSNGTEIGWKRCEGTFWSDDNVRRVWVTKTCAFVETSNGIFKADTFTLCT